MGEIRWSLWTICFTFPCNHFEKIESHQKRFEELYILAHPSDGHCCCGAYVDENIVYQGFWWTSHHFQYVCRSRRAQCHPYLFTKSNFLRHCLAIDQKHIRRQCRSQKIHFPFWRLFRRTTTILPEKRIWDFERRHFLWGTGHHGISPPFDKTAFHFDREHSFANIVHQHSDFGCRSLHKFVQNRNRKSDNNSCQQTIAKNLQTVTNKQHNFRFFRSSHFFNCSFLQIRFNCCFHCERERRQKQTSTNC